MSRFLALVTAIGCLACNAQAQELQQQRQLINEGTVGLITARADSAFTRLGDDMGLALDGEGLRVLPTLGRGSLSNVEDLLFLRGIDFAFTQADTLDFMEAVDAYPNIKKHVRFVAKLPSEEMHLLAGSAITDIRQLEGKRVNFGKELTGSFLTASVVFDKLGITVEVTSFPHGEAYKRLVSGDIQAMVKVDGKPVKLISKATLDDAVHLINVPYEELSDTYESATLTSNDYPRLLPAGDSVNTVSVAAVLAAYNFSTNADRRARSDRFIKALYDNIDVLRDPENGFDPKWADVDLNLDVAGWERAEMASQLLASQ